MKISDEKNTFYSTKGVFSNAVEGVTSKMFLKACPQIPMLQYNINIRR